MVENNSPLWGDDSPILTGPRLLKSLRPLFPGAPPIAIQTDASVDRAAIVARLAKTEHLGVVHTIKAKTVQKRIKRARELVAAHRGVGADVRMVMFDASRYNGNARASGVHSLNPEWVQAQWDMGLAMALTDSPYIPNGDRLALQSVLQQAGAMAQPVTAVLPLGLEWLKRDAHLIRDAINAAGIPVALVLEHAKDPLGVQAALKGLVHVLQGARTPVVLLRSDLAAIGAVACGASMGAVGTRPSHRHLFPVTKGGGGGGTKFTSAFVPHSMDYRRLETINLAKGRVPDNPEWFTCECAYCGGRGLDWIDTAEQAYLHSASAIARLTAEVFDGPDGPAGAKQTWLAKCENAQHINLIINHALDGGWEPQEFLGAWRVAFHPTA